MHVQLLNDALVVTVDKKHDGLTAEQFMQSILMLPHGFIQTLVKSSRVRLQGRSVFAQAPIAKGQKIWFLGGIETNPASGKLVVHPESETGEGIEHSILYEDEHILILDKPTNLIVHPGNPDDRDTMDHRVAEYYLRSGQHRAVLHAHRLDRGTTGAIVYAKHAYIARALDLQLQRHEMKRTYLAITLGRKLPASGRIDAPIGRDCHVSGRYRVSRSGKQAVTHYRILASAVCSDGVLSLVQCQLETGRTHQIRVHLSHQGVPIVGDALYSGRYHGSFCTPDIGIALHASSVQLFHPYEEQWLKIEAPLPRIWGTMLQELKWDAGASLS